MLFITHSLVWLGECCRVMKYCISLAFFIVPVCLSAETELPVLATDTNLATAGYYQLSWQPGIAGASNKNIHFEVQQARDLSFHSSKTIYRGPDQASVISGQPNGDYFYRVRVKYTQQVMGEWSKPVLVKVQHHPLKKAWLFFIAGAIVFTITFIFIVYSSRKCVGDNG